MALRRYLWGSSAPLGLAVVLATLVLDQAHKFWMLSVYDIASKGRVSVTPYLDLVYVKNIGISYSLFNQSSEAGQYLLALFAALASVLLWVWLNRGHPGRKLAAVSLGLIIGGAVGNAIDRLRLGGVADFFLLHAYGYQWYVFNIADVAIVAGVLGLLYESFVHES